MSCICLPFELILALGGILALIVGKIGLGRIPFRIVEGSAARVAGFVLLIPIVVGVLCLGSELLVLSSGDEQLAGGVAAITMMVQGCVVPGSFLTFVFIVIICGRPPRSGAQGIAREL